MLAYSDPRRSLKKRESSRSGTRRSKRPTPTFQDFTFSDFFFKGPNDIDVSGISIEWSYFDEAPLVIQKQSTKWMRYERRPKREVVYIGMARCVPAIEQRGLRTRFRQAATATLHGALEPAYLARLSDILGMPFTNASVYGDDRHGLRSLEGRATYSGFNMGAGEDAIVQILYALQSVGNGALVGIEEIEIGIHSSALVRLARHIVEIALKKQLQIIVTSHSEHFIDALPRRSRILLQRLDSKSHVVSGPTTRMALTDMADARHHDLSIYVEDTVAAQLVMLALDQDLRRRVEVKAIGSNSEFPAVARFLRNSMPDQRFLYLLDGDTRQNIINGMFRDAGTPPPCEADEPLSTRARPLTAPSHNQWIALLPSDQPPEQWMVSELLGSGVGPQALADQLNLSSPDAAAEHLHRLSTLPDKHTAFTDSEQLLCLPSGSACHAFIRALYRARPEIREQIASLVTAALKDPHGVNAARETATQPAQAVAQRP